MTANEFGQIFKITTFGESHGSGMGTLIQGCPSGVTFNESILVDLLQRRRPGQSPWVTSRNEPDQYEILSGVYKGKTLGTPIAVIVKNKDQKSSDYKNIQTQARTGHADDVWKQKFQHIDHRGGGRSSGRETLSRVIGGAFAKMYLRSCGQDVDVLSNIKQLGPLKNTSTGPYPEGSEEFLLKAKEQGESYGGHVHVSLQSVPKGLGQPVFKKLKSELTSAYMSVGAVVGVQLADAFTQVLLKGTDYHDDNQNLYQGIRGGISTGESINFDIAMKPTSSILDVAKKGRHDPCILIRALPVFEAMTYLVLADQVLWQKLDNI